MSRASEKPYLDGETAPLDIAPKEAKNDDRIYHGRVDLERMFVMASCSVCSFAARAPSFSDIRVAGPANSKVISVALRRLIKRHEHTEELLELSLSEYIVLDSSCPCSWARLGPP